MPSWISCLIRSSISHNSVSYCMIVASLKLTGHRFLLSASSLLSVLRARRGSSLLPGSTTSDAGKGRWVRPHREDSWVTQLLERFSGLTKMIDETAVYINLVHQVKRWFSSGDVTDDPKPNARTAGSQSASERQVKYDDDLLLVDRYHDILAYRSSESTTYETHNLGI
jgi:hypothetical protein